MADNPGLDQIISNAIGTYLADPQDLPQEFLDWLPQYLAANPPALQNSDLAGGTITPIDGGSHNLTWGAGTLTYSSATSASDIQQHDLGDIPTFLVAYSTVAGCGLAGSADNAQVETTGTFAAPFTGTVTYFWLAIV